MFFPGANPIMKHPKDASLGLALALSAKLRPGWKVLPGTNTLTTNIRKLWINFITLNTAIYKFSKLIFF